MLFDRKYGGYFEITTVVLLFALGGCGQSPHTKTAPHEEVRTSNSTNRTSAWYDLDRDEYRGGHTLSRHVARSDEQLQERLNNERNISAASTWTDRQTAEKTVAAALRAEQEKIDGWQSRGERRANLVLHFDAGHPIGRSLRRGTREVIPCTRAVIVLRADGPDNFYVLTTYPEGRE